MNYFIFIPLGAPILFFDTLVDLLYFWINNFRTNLKKIIIEKDKSTVSHRSLKEIMNICDNFKELKIKTIHTSEMIKQFRKKFQVNKNLRFLIFG